MQFKAWRSRDDVCLHVICGEGDAFEQLPEKVRHQGPWIGSREGNMADLLPHYRALVEEQGFCVVYRRPFEFAPVRGDAPRVGN